jgi:hypothetical protein
MTKFVLAAALLTLAACGEKKAETPAADTTAAAAPAPAPATPDSMARDTASDTTKTQ